MTHTTSPVNKGLIFLLTIAVGVIAANLYYAQPLVSLISQSLGLESAAAGLIVTLTQVGYGLGVLLIVPLGDLVENRRLILTMLGISICALIGLNFATQLVPYFCAALGLGLGVSAVQIIVPYAAHLVPESQRGRTVGGMMSGLMLGIMLSRPAASFLTDLFSWHAIFLLSAVLMFLLGIALYRYLPERRPAVLNIRYSQLIISMAHLFARTPVLRRRAIYQACMFGAFCLFWTTTPLLLTGPEFQLSQTAVAFFALAGVAGAISAPLAGLAADNGWSRVGTTVAMLAAALSFLMTLIIPMGSVLSLALLTTSAILLDAGITANLVLGQRAIFSLRAKYRGRLNGLYVATIFVGGAIGSSAGVWAYSHGGWTMTAWAGFAMPALAFIYFCTEWLTGFQKRGRRKVK